MKVTWIVYLLLFVCSSCNSQSYSSKLLSEGVLLSPNGGIFWDDTISIFNQDGSDYAKVWADKNGISKVNYLDTTGVKIAITESTNNIGNGRLPKISVRCFDDGYDSPLMVFDAKKLEDKYQVFVNGEWKGINYPKPLVYKKWNEFILTVNLGITQISPLRSDRNNNSEIINDYEKYSYEVIKLDGDWLQVRCWSDCEGCPDGRVITGWVKWKDEDKLLIELYYIC